MTSPFFDPRVRDFFSHEFGQEVQAKWPDFTMFTPWLLLDDTTHLVQDEDGLFPIGVYRGVYLVAVFPTAREVPQGPADPFDSSVVYIGRTRTARLASRWTQFKKALQGRGGHSGGNSFYATLVKPAGECGEDLLARTRIAGLPVFQEGRNNKFSAKRTSFRTAVLESVLVEAVHAHQAENGGSRLLNKK